MHSDIHQHHVIKHTFIYQAAITTKLFILQIVYIIINSTVTLAVTN